MRNLTIPVFALLLFTGCWPIDTDDPDKAYEYWSQTNKPDSIEVLKGQYEQSAHFTLEYEVYLKVKANNRWFDQLKVGRNLSVDTSGWEHPSYDPEWFQPSPSSVMYSVQHEFDRSRYFRDTVTNVCYIVEAYGGM